MSTPLRPIKLADIGLAAIIALALLMFAYIVIVMAVSNKIEAQTSAVYCSTMITGTNCLCKIGDPRRIFVPLFEEPASTCLQ